jgi:predicted O-methyltransferase YrrM
MLMTKNKRLRLIFGALETCNWLQLKLWLKQPSSARSFPGHMLRKYMMLARQDRWRSITIEELLPTSNRYQVTLVHMEGQGLQTSLSELLCLALVTSSANPSRIFEIGTFWGRTALNFALNSPEECIIYTLDLPVEGRPEIASDTNAFDARLIATCKTGVQYQDAAAGKKIRQLLGNSLTFDFSPYHSSMDIVFVDGSHHYEAALSDTRNALKMVRPGGWILWHDFANYGDYHDVTRAVLDVLPADEIVQIGDTQLAFYRKPLAGHTKSSGSAFGHP